MSDFSNEIKKLRHNITRNQRKCSSGFVDEIFSLKHHADNPESHYGTPDSGVTDTEPVNDVALQASVEPRVEAFDVLVEHETMFNMSDWNDFAMELPEGLFQDLECLDIPLY